MNDQNHLSAGVSAAGAEISRVAREEIAPAARLIEDTFSGAARAIERVYEATIEEFAGLLRRAVESGIVRLACVQVEHHLLLSQDRLLAYATPLGIALTSYTPVAKGQVAELPEVRRIAAKHGATPAQVALAWLLAMPGVAAIPKSASRTRQAENLAALTLRLDAEDLAALAALPKDRRLVDPGFAPDWDA